jgi:mannose-6-phosphate isomerase-like protein (cupin superfamily)
LAETPETGATHVDLVALLGSRGGPGAVWTHASADLNVNLVAFGEGLGVNAHVNSDVDVLLVAIEGQARVVVEDVVHMLRGGQALVIPKGSRREIRSLNGQFTYLTCHRRRPGLWPVNVPRPEAERAS